nr:immunoglobulin heavy chain junction region [Macaca mulatta]
CARDPITRMITITILNRFDVW